VAVFGLEHKTPKIRDLVCNSTILSKNSTKYFEIDKQSRRSSKKFNVKKFFSAKIEKNGVTIKK
jgi:hypothetical protein